MTHGKKQRNQIRSSSVAFQNPPLIPPLSFLSFFPPLLISITPLVVFRLLLNSNFFQEAPSCYIHWVTQQGRVSSGGILHLLISLRWFVISRLPCIFRVKTVTQSSCDPFHSSSIKINLSQSPKENESPQKTCNKHLNAQ